jgi:hypothetical protein
MKRAIATALALACASPLLLAAGAPAPARYQIQLVMHEDGRAPVRPSLVVEAGEPATFMVGNERYNWRVVATPHAGRVVVASDIAAWSPQGLRPNGSSLELAADGAPATISFRRVDPSTGIAGDVRIEISATPLD